MARLLTPLNRAALRAEDFLQAEQALTPPLMQPHISVWHRLYDVFHRHRLAKICLVFLALMTIASLLAPFSPHDPEAINSTRKMEAPSAQHWLGTDELGRDSLTRALYGGRISLLVGVCAMCVSVVIGTALGAVSGYWGGTTDAWVMRLVDILQSLPSLLMIIVFFSLFPKNMATLIIMLAFFSWPGVARIVRAQTLSLRERDFIAAAKLLGVPSVRILIRHVLPNVSTQMIVAASLSIAGAILDESALSFLGYGVPLPKSSWGSMLQSAQQYILYDPLLAFIPGACILLTVMCLNILGDTLQQALDPRLSI